MILSFCLLAFILSLVSAASIPLIEKRAAVFNGSPGYMCYADSYNDLGNNWNRTYALNEPQQIYLALTDDAVTARVQFATLGEIEKSVFQYWPVKNSKKSVTVYGKVSFFLMFIYFTKKLGL
jgi:hypothetical protein